MPILHAVQIETVLVALSRANDQLIAATVSEPLGTDVDPPSNVLSLRRSDGRLTIRTWRVTSDEEVWSYSAFDPVPADVLTILRNAYRIEKGVCRPDPYQLVRKPDFTILELRRAHEAVLGYLIDKDTFRRRVADQLVSLGTTNARFITPTSRNGGTIGRPAELYSRSTR